MNAQGGSEGGTSETETGRETTGERLSMKDRNRRMNVKRDASNADSWARRQMDKDMYREGVAVHKQSLTCSVCLSHVFLSCFRK